MATESEILHKIFTITPDNKMIVKIPYLKVVLPEDFFKHKIAEITGTNIDTIGIFYMYAYGVDDKEFDFDNPKNPIKILFKMPMKVVLSPCEIKDNQRDENGKLVTVLEFMQDDVFITSTLFVRTWKTVSKVIDLILKGFLPKELSYDRIMSFIEKCTSENKTDTQVADTIMEILIAELARDPKHTERPFRMAVAENSKIDMKSAKYIKVDTLARMYNSFAAISSGDPKQGITMSINRKRYGRAQKESSIESAISDV